MKFQFNRYLNIYILSSSIGIIIGNLIFFYNYFIIGALLILVYLYFKLKKATDGFKILIISILLFIIFFIAGYLIQDFYHKDLKEKENLVGKYSGEVEVVSRNQKKDTYQYIGAGENGQIEGRKIVFYAKEKYISGTLLKVSGNLTVGEEPLNTGGYSQKEFYRSRGIDFELKTESIIKIGDKFSILGFFYEYRSGYVEELDKNLSEDGKAIVNSLLFSDRSFMSDESLDGIQALGLGHLFAVSGLHIAVIYEVLMIIFLYLNLKWGRILIMIFLLIFAVILSSPSVFRAVFTFFIVFGMEKIGIIKNKLVIFTLVLGLNLIIFPNFVYSIGFYLTYSIALGFIFIMETKKNKFIKMLLLPLWMIPILSLGINSFSPLTILLTPVLSLFMGAYLGMILLTFVTPLGFIIFPIVDQLAIVLINFFKWGNNLQFLIIDVPQRKVIYIFIYYILLVLMHGIYMQDKEKKRVIKCLLTILFSIYLICFLFPWRSQNLEIHFINVGQGDSILILPPGDSKCIIVDFGRDLFSKNMGRDEVAPYLRRLGINNAYFLISTHGDNDHLGGLEYLSSQIKFDSIILSPFDIDGKYDKIKSVRDGLWKFFKGGDSFEINGVEFKIMSPYLNDDIVESNDSSIVIEISYKDKKILLTGDTPVKNLEKLNNNHYDIIQASHHGSKTGYSEGLYLKFQPEYVAISVGKNNRYGHPSKQLISELTNGNIKYKRTDRDQNIVFLIGDKIELKKGD